jgi:hypothetical protein
MLVPLGSDAAEPALWRHVSESSIGGGTDRAPRLPTAYKTLQLNQNLLAQLLAKAPLEFTPAAKQKEVIITIPKPDGGFARFRIEESPMVSPQVAAQVPDWKTYSGRGIDDPTAVLRFSWSAAGLSASVLGVDGAYYVEPYSKRDRAHYLVFHRRDASSEGGLFHCLALL